MDDLSRFCCQNSLCPGYGTRNAGNLTVCMHYGKSKQLRLLYCRTCRARFSERKGTPLFQSRLPDEKCLSVLEHIAEGCGVRWDQSSCPCQQVNGGPLCSLSRESCPDAA